MNAWRGRRSIAAIAVLLALSGCGGSKPSQVGAPNPVGSNASPDPKAKAKGPSGTLKLTGYYTYDGPFTGQFDCFHNSSGYFELEGQDPYLMDITLKQMHEGTFIVKPQDPATGYSADVPGQGFVDVRRLEPSTDINAPTFRQNGGTITFTNGGDTGVLIADYVDIRDGSHTVHAELRWKDCPLSH